MDQVDEKVQEVLSTDDAFMIARPLSHFMFDDAVHILSQYIAESGVPVRAPLKSKRSSIELNKSATDAVRFTFCLKNFDCFFAVGLMLKMLISRALNGAITDKRASLKHAPAWNVKQLGSVMTELGKWDCDIFKVSAMTCFVLSLSVSHSLA